MQSLRELYRIGTGPSSSHTMAPQKASVMFLNEFPDADKYVITLYGSLAKTGKGHMTDKAIYAVFSQKNVEVVFDKETFDIEHPNTMDLEAHYPDGIKKWRAVSPGGGQLRINGEHLNAKPVYPHRSLDHIKEYCLSKGIRLWEYVVSCEGEEILDYLNKVYQTMKNAIDEGLKKDGILEGGLKVVRKAKWLYSQKHIDESPETRENRLVCAFAFAVSEQNASAGTIVTAPTCGACGVLPAVLKYMQIRRGFTDEDCVKALATAGLIGNLIKTNASISGAECGCQAEIGSACSMAAAALGELYGMCINQIEYAAEISIEHHLGLTCDPIGGLVQIPCIERNAVASMRAINAVSLANFLTGTRQISFDSIVQTMYETGRDLPMSYRETSESGMAKIKL